MGDAMLGGIRQRAEKANAPAAGDYEEGGVLMCGRCRTPKQKLIEIAGQTMKVPCMCRCAAEADEKAREEQGRTEFRALLTDMWNGDGICNRAFERCSFDHDDGQDERNMRVCRRYAEKWEAVREKNIGLLLTGTVGTGKSFAASAIASALIRKRVTVCVTNFPRLLNLLQDAQRRQALLDRLNLYSLLVIDDLGVERDSGYACEQIFNVIDARAQAEKPLIVTTNLTLDALQNDNSTERARIYDRILEMCPVRLVMTGTSRRTKNAEERTAFAREILR